MEKKDKKIKIAIVSHALINPPSQTRWKKLSKNKNYEVHLITPKKWESNWFGEKIFFESEEVHQDNFHVHPILTTSTKNWSKYLFFSFSAKLSSIKPDIVYVISSEKELILQQIIFYKKIFCPNAKIIFFSQNGMGVPLNKFHQKIRWRNIVKNTDAAIVHYPGCMNSLRSAGYNKPIYMQTQIGVDENQFKENQAIREKYRKKLGFENNFVIGYCGRLTTDKGVDDIVSVFIDLAKTRKNLSLLLIGNGELKNDIEKKVEENNLDNKIHITGYINQDEVPNYMNALDLLYIGSKTTPHWIDTFPLVTVQAQAIGIPVISSNSASLPWQLSNTAQFFSEGNQKELKESLKILIKDETIRKNYSAEGQKRSYYYFCHNGMNENFIKIINQVIAEKNIFHENDEKYTQYKAY